MPGKTLPKMLWFKFTFNRGWEIKLLDILLDFSLRRRCRFCWRRGRFRRWRGSRSREQGFHKFSLTIHIAFQTFCLHVEILFQFLFQFFRDRLLNSEHLVYLKLKMDLCYIKILNSAVEYNTFISMWAFISAWSAISRSFRSFSADSKLSTFFLKNKN